jgi:IS1 family transposase
VNTLDVKRKAGILTALCEGNSIASTCRMTGAAKNTVIKLLVEVGEACGVYQDRVLRDLNCKRVQCDEIWSFVGSKEKNTTPKTKREGAGDVWTWTAIDADSKLIVSWLVGGRDAGFAHAFMQDVAARLASRVQLTVDGHKPYLQAVANAFGNDIDFAQLIKVYGQPQHREAHRKYSPAECSGTIVGKTIGKPDEAHISTSFVERQNLTMRMSMRRFTRLTNAFSKKLANHEAAIALHFMHYNFCRIHKTLRVTPAMEAGVCDYVWSMEDVLMMVETMDRGVVTECRSN